MSQGVEPGAMGGDLFATAIRPMLAVSVGRPFDSPDHLFEVKWDGYRGVAFVETGGPGGTGAHVRLQTRNLLDMTAHYPELAEIAGQVEGKRAILDGEIISWHAGRPDFGRLHRGEGPFHFVAFDLLYHDGADMTGLPLIERRERLNRVVHPGGRVIISDVVPERGVDLYRAIVAKDLEGMMAKARLSPYLPGRRSPYWVKVRNVKRMDCVICGYTVGHNFGHFGALILGAYSGGHLVYVGHAGTGFGAEEVNRLMTQMTQRATAPFSSPAPAEVRRRARWAEPRLACEIEYTELTADRRLRHPTYRGLRPDKSPEECTLEGGPVT
ncbi:MAG: non-homologous end-joining DNA ligase [Bacillota bacterium]